MAADFLILQHNNENTHYSYVVYLCDASYFLQIIVARNNIVKISQDL